MTKRRALCIFLVLSLMAVLAACGSSKTVERENQISQDGKVPAETFEALKESGDLAMFTGEENGIIYRWTFIGTDIDQSEDADLRIHFNTTPEPSLFETLEAKELLSFSFEDARQKPGKPTVEISLGNGWESGQAAVYALMENAQPRLVCDATLGENTVAFTPSEYEGTFYLALKDMLVQTAAPQQTPSPEATELPAENTPQPKEDSKEKEKPAGQEAPEQNSGTAPQQESPAVVTEPPAAENQQPTVSLSIRCDMALKNYDRLDNSVRDDRIVPPSGQILYVPDLAFSEGESVFDVLQRTCREHKIHMESTYTPIRKSAYVEGINNLYEFSCGPLSGWMYSVNGWYPNYGCSIYELKDGDVIEWNYTCDLGRDLGQHGVVQQSKD